MTSIPASFTVDRSVAAGGSNFHSIQDAINAASYGTTITVADGVYNENLTIAVSGITLVSANGRGAVTINGSVGSLGTVVLTGGASDVVIGDAGKGFTINGFDNVTPGLETAAVYIQGNGSNLTIRGNEIVANGDAGLQNEFGSTVTNVVVDGNIFSGQTFTGQPGFGDQFTVPNVPRQVVVLGDNGPSLTTNITFTNNDITATAGGLTSGGAVSGNTLVTIDAANSIITGNDFTGFTNRFASQLRVREEGTVITGNTFANANGGNIGLFTQFASGETPGLMANNSYDYGAGDDAIVAVAGNDFVDGGSGIDTYVMSNAGTGGSFVDLKSGLAFSSTTGIDTLVNIENVSGSAGADGLFGTDTANVFFATAGTDVVDGRGGVDTFDASSASSSITANLTTGSVTGAFTATLTSIENVFTGSGNDRITLGDGANSVDAGAGNDTIDTGALTNTGNDVIGGGAGIDTVSFAGTRAEYIILINGATTTVTNISTGASANINNVGRLDFSDKDVFLVDDTSSDYSTIQSAIDAAANGDQIMVAEGTYTGDVTINKSVTILGASAGIDGDAPRTATSALAGTFILAADGITIDGMDINGGGTLAYGVRGQSGNSVHSNITITNSVFNGQTSQAILNGFGFGGGIGATNWTVTDNVITDVKGNNATAIALFNITGLTLTGNFVDHDLGAYTGRRGINLDGIIQGIISDNTVQLGGPTGTSWGIQIGMSDRGTQSMTIDGNTITGAATGILGLSQRDMMIINITDNTITGGTNGIVLNGGSAVPAEVQPAFIQVTVMGNTIDATGLAVFVRDLHSTNPNGPITFHDLKVDDNSILSGTVRLGGADSLGGVLLNVTGTLTVEGSANNDRVEIEGFGNATFVAGDGNDLFVGGSGADFVNGGAGNDSMTGGAGSDTLDGGTGNDTYNVDDADAIVEAAGGGTDTVVATESFTLGAGAEVENLTLAGLATSTETFQGFTPGAITNGENGWAFYGGTKDQEVVVDPNNPLNLMFRMSSDPNNADFSGPYSPRLPLSAGEPSTTADADSHAISFDFRAIAAGDMSRLEVDFGNDSQTDRNNFLVIENTATGIRIAVNEPNPDGSFTTGFDAYTGNRELVSGIDPLANHTLAMVARYIDGPDNDVIDIYLDGALIGTTTSFENFRDALGGTHDANAEANQSSSLFFRGGAGISDGPGGQNQGFLFDNITNTVFNSGNSLTGNEFAQTLTGDAGDNMLSGMGGADTVDGGLGADVLNGGTGDDLLNGGGGTDTAVYAGVTYSEATFAFTSGTLTVTTAAGGTDTLNSVEKVAFDGKTVLIVGEGGFASIQDAVNASASGDVILVTEGTYTENVTITDKAVSIVGNGAVTVNGSFLVSDEMVAGDRMTFENITIDAAGQNYGISVRSSATDVPGVNAGTVVLDNVNISNAGGHGLFYAHPSGGSNPTNVNTIGSFQITGSDFSNNGQVYSGGQGQGHINLFGFNGNLSVVDTNFASNVTDFGNGAIRGGTISTVGANVNADKAISVTGVRTGTPGVGGYIDSGSLTLENVNLQGLYSTDAISFYGIQSFASTSFTGVSIIASAPWGLINFDNVGGAINLGNDNAAFSGFNLSTGAPLAVVQGLASNDTVTGTVGNDVIYGRAGADSLIGGSGDDLFVYTSVAEFASGEAVRANDGNDTLLFAATSAEILNLLPTVVDIENVTLLNTPSSTVAAGINAQYVANRLVISGNNGDNALTGTAYSDTISGFSGNDMLVGGEGDDSILGGAGNDSLQGGIGLDQLQGGAGADVLNGGAGNDEANYEASTAAVSINLFLGTATGGDATGDTLALIENLRGSNLADGLIGDDVNNAFFGLDGADSLDGAAGNDNLFGGSGNDSITGGSGNDFLLGDGGNDTLVDGAGNDYLGGGDGTGDRAVFASNWSAYNISRSGTTYTITAGSFTDTVVDVETFVFNNTAIDVTADADIIVTNAGPSVVSVVEAGVDEDTTPATLSTDENAANGTVVATLTAKDSNIALGDALTYSLVGPGGVAYTGPFTIVKLSETTAEVRVSGALNFEAVGSYTFTAKVTDINGNSITQDLTVAVNDVNEGPNNGQPIPDWAPAAVEAGLERAVLTGTPVITDPEGTALTYELLTAPTQGALFSGLAVTVGRVLTQAEFNALTYQANETAGGPFVAQFRVSDGVNTSNFNLAITVSAGVNGTFTGDDAANAFDGGAGNDYLSGLGGNDTLIGGTGNDTLNGGAGADVMTGGAGDEWYFVSAGDTIVETAGGGTGDRVLASASYTLAANVDIEQLTTTTQSGTALINLTGNNLAQRITGNAAGNILDGSGGDDTLLGLDGADSLFGGNGNDRMEGGRDSDRYYVNSVGDTVIEAAGNGTDRVLSSLSYTLTAGASIEELTTTSQAATTAINLTGNEVAQVVIGNAGANVLNGMGGNDTLTGLGGADTFVFSTALGNGNVDVITDFSVVDDTIQLSAAVFVGLTGGATLSATAFTVNNAGVATSADHRIIYEKDTGSLWYDADGTGVSARVYFGDLASNLAITNADFFVLA